MAHVMRLADVEAELPPIVVDRSNLRVIDGMHRLMAASLRGAETIAVQFFDGSPAETFLHAVEANVTHGLPLSQADRRAAAAKIMSMNPNVSDRAIAQASGLAARTVAAIRRSTDTLSRIDGRVGLDGRVRPVDPIEGRRRAAEFIGHYPMASLREVAREVGLSPSTVRDVRLRLARGEDPAPVRQWPAGGQSVVAAVPSGPDRPTGIVPALAARAEEVGRLAGPPEANVPAGEGLAQVPSAAFCVLDKLFRDPALRNHEQGRRLLRLLQNNAVRSKDWSELMSAIPPHCLAMVEQVARNYSQMWLELAQELDWRAGVVDPSGRRERPLERLG
jgi:ParB-like chromosome segregation protein Spo0J